MIFEKKYFLILKYAEYEYLKIAELYFKDFINIGAKPLKLHICIIQGSSYGKGALLEKKTMIIIPIA